MPTDSVGVLCGECRARLDEGPSDPVDSRTPCPHCGALSRQVNTALGGAVAPHSRLSMKGKRAGLKRPFIEQTVGDDLHRASQRWMQLHRVVDRLRNWYSERVTDPESGEVIHSCEEPLADHRGHGSDKKPT